MIAQYEGRIETPDLLKAPRQYALNQQHKHLPEMKKMALLDFEPAFSPHVSDYYSGMSVVVPIHTRLMRGHEGKGGEAAISEIRKRFEDRYRGEPFVKVRSRESNPEGGFLSAMTMSGRNDLEIFIMGNEERILLTAGYDNLGKGASGAGIQCMNLMLGIPEERGLL
jgi:N-acetyl-gamma-glutamyl-phosphate reductase